MIAADRQEARPRFARMWDSLGAGTPANAFDRNNALSVFLMGAMPAIAGSAISFMLAAFIVWGLVSLAFRRFPFRMTHSDRLLATTFTGFAGLILVTAMLGENRDQVFRSTVWLLPFLSLWVVIPRLRASPGLDYLRLYILGAVAGCVGAAALSTFEIVWLGAPRAEGGAGNAAVFAIMSLCLAGIAGLAIDFRERALRVAAMVALLAGTLAVLLSLTRGVAIALLPILFLLFVHASNRWRAMLLHPLVIAAAATAAVIIYGMWDLIDIRIAQTLRETDELLDGDMATGLGTRVRLWSAAWAAFLEMPLTGHGIQNRMDVLIPHMIQDGLQLFGFTHPHNGYLTAALDGGLPVVAALLAVLAMPVMVAWRAPSGASYRRRLFLALILVTAYATIGLTQIMYKHDIMDSFYIFSVIVLAVSIPAVVDRRG